MADGKWISGLTFDTPVLEAAHRVLSVRLKVIQHYLPLAAEKPEKNIEYVHQLRVGTRRARAALEIFADCVPNKVQKRARKRLRRIRQAAGDARDWDVFRLMLREWAMQRPDREKAGLDFLRGLAFQNRLTAQDELFDAADKGMNRSEVLSSLRVPKGKRAPNRFGDMALPVLEAALADLDEAISGRATGFEYLHRIRILGKRLRYAMEVFADCFTPPFRQMMYPAVEQMQEILGAANDSHVVVQRLEDLREDLKRAGRSDWSHCRLGLERLLQMHRRRLPEARKKFSGWRTRWKKSSQPLCELLLAPVRQTAK